ncbi:16S rRNA (guanine(527)-N(7))-methyltransferase RsmG [Flexibacterium corallicola]|uniref:16S rRNA (guanine(527)-N(7))-methyltransferase RsmG n=1 Tax=Flexibacterium corallicola TaxID=3037259 RepID=UPI00286EC090|nr:16S rRNA (guanine(527)-N(7))-methyltransferase RsmG [Pseudovibrio sp. M1P-2-3]
MTTLSNSDSDQIEMLKRMYPDVSRETIDSFSIYVDLVRKWQPAQNLIAPSTMGDIWLRHVADSIQIQKSLPSASQWIDFGSGAGFPGLITAILLKDKEGSLVNLVESNQRKASFLRTVARETGSRVKVHAGRIEAVTKDWETPIEGVSARALASLDMLCGFSSQFIERGATAVFHKGQDFRREIDEASQNWELDLVEKDSLVDPQSKVLLISKMTARQA